MSLDSVATWGPTALIALVGWLLKNAIGRVTDRFDNALGRTNDRVAIVEERVTKAEDALTETVSAEDWVRESMRLRDEVRDISRMLHRMDGKTDVSLQIAQAMTKMGKSVESSVNALAAITEDIKGSPS